MKPARGILFCKPVKTAETLDGSKIVLLDDTRQRWVGQQAEVTAVGAATICDDPDCERSHGYAPQRPPILFKGAGPQGARRLIDGWQPTDDVDCLWFHPCGVEAGDWVLVEPRMFVEVSDGVWALPQDSVLAVLMP